MALRGHYELEEASGTRVDSVGTYDLDEIVNDSVTAVPGVIGNALNADAAFGHVGKTVGLPAWDGSATGFSYTFWVLFNNANAPGVTEFILRLGGGAGGRIANVSRAASGRVGTEVRDTATTYSETSNSVIFATPGIWTFVAVTYARLDFFETFVNGVLDNPGKPTNDFDLKSMGADPMIRLGANAAGGLQLDGAIDDLRFYDHKLTPAEVTALFLGTGGGGSSTGSRRSSNGWYRSFTG